MAIRLVVSPVVGRQDGGIDEEEKRRSSLEVFVDENAIQSDGNVRQDGGMDGADGGRTLTTLGRSARNEGGYGGGGRRCARKFFRHPVDGGIGAVVTVEDYRPQ
ncbi:hypothetical protein Salat_1558800 [Sesamum alatum]|uniref:Uncharacterized protein n=1 Tax=Sesamum alatum TaxID=300844 RepID=A0AAE1YD37_9LAMI|nr:hypothetical protein Salat_1558800 [Sesamum alatum]